MSDRNLQYFAICCAAAAVLLALSFFTHAADQVPQIVLSCTPPSKYLSGAPLPASDIPAAKAYEFFEVKSTGNVSLGRFDSCAATIPGAVGEHAYAATVTTKNGLTSAISNIATITVTNMDKTAPAGMRSFQAAVRYTNQPQ